MKIDVASFTQAVVDDNRAARYQPIEIRERNAMLKTHYESLNNEERAALHLEIYAELRALPEEAGLEFDDDGDGICTNAEDFTLAYLFEGCNH